VKIALTGNPNSGKTTLFNAITGKIEHVGNWPGVTVEKKEGKIKRQLTPNDKEVIVVDLPGAYSISPYTGEESITKDFIENEKPDVIINIVDSTNLSRSLFFTTQLLELNIPMVIALNKKDLNEKKGNKININKLSKLLICPVIETVSTKNNENGLAKLVEEAVNIGENKKSQVSPKIKKLKDIKENKEDQDRIYYDFVNEVIKAVEKKKVNSNMETSQDKIDRIVANKWVGIPLFVVIIWVVFSLSQTWIGPFFADLLVGWIDNLYSFVEGLIGEGTNPVLASLLLDGIIGGVGAVVGFLPLIMVLFFLLALLEDCGYMARVAVVLDRFLKKVGLSGRSIIPMVIGTGCAIPGIMATRTIKDERQRRTTAMLTPFMPCGAKLPIIALLAGVFFNGNGWIGTAMYFLAIIVIILSSLIIRKINGDKSVSYFIMELPEYKIPSLKRAALSMLDRGKAFIIKAGTIILICNAIIQLLQTFNWNFEVTDVAKDSILASISSPLVVVFIPLGFGMWQFVAAAVTGFIAKENVVGTLAVCFSVTNFIDIEELALVGGGTEVATIFGITSIAGLSYLVFNLFTPPCFAAIGSMNSEINSSKWFWGAIAFQMSVGYTLAYLTYQIGTLFMTGSIGEGFFGGLIAVAAIATIVIVLMINGSKNEESVGKEAGDAV
jgi:ferrous iron transport protein B